MNVVDAIAETETDKNDRPKRAIRIKYIKMVK
jgi:hypothetical protein